MHIILITQMIAVHIHLCLKLEKEEKINLCEKQIHLNVTDLLYLYVILM